MARRSANGKRGLACSEIPNIWFAAQKFESHGLEMLRSLTLSHLFVMLMFGPSVVLSIDRNEKLGRCINGFEVPHVHHMQQNEGIWFPQYRTRDPRNKKYKCHTVYEKMDYGYPTTIYSESYYTVDGKPLRDPYAQSYRQEEKGVLVDEENDIRDDFYKVYSYTIAITENYRVRYVCTDHPESVSSAPLVYIETRKSIPSHEDVKSAFMEVRRTGFKLTLEKIDQNKCIRPLGYDGYDSSPEHDKNDGKS